MNKQKRMTKQLIILAAIGLGIVGSCGVLFYVTDTMLSGAQEEKTKAEGELSSLRGENTELQAQLDQSGHSENEYAKIKQSRTNVDFSPNADALRAMLGEAKNQFRFSNGSKLTITPEVPTKKAKLKAISNYAIMVRPTMKMDIEAISDMHVFSFLKALEQEAPGFVRVTSVSIKRKSDMDAASITDMQHGGAPTLVEASVEFDWIGINEKGAGAAAKSPDDAEEGN